MLNKKKKAKRKMDKRKKAEEKSFIADTEPVIIAYQELTLNLKHQGYERGYKRSKRFFEPIAFWLYNRGLI